MANQSYSLFKKFFITIFAYSFVLSSCFSSVEPKLCNFDELNKNGKQNIENCNVGLLRTCALEKIYQLGDSISDAGNLIRERPEGAAAPFARLPYGSNFPTGPTGRASNGNLMIDYLALDAGLPLLPPFKKRDADFSHGVNFAVAGSTALTPAALTALHITSPPMNASSLSVQLDWMATYFSNNQTGSGGKTRNALFVLGPFGGTDYEYALLQGKSVQEIEATLIPKVVNATMGVVDRLIRMGAERVVVPGLYTISGLPIYQTVVPKETSKVNDDLAVRHNAQLQQAIKKFIKERTPYTLIAYIDYFSAYQGLQSYAATSGKGMDEKVCCGSGGGKYNFNLTRSCGADGVVACSDPEKHISWDGMNLTQEAYRIMSKYIVYAISQILGCPNR